MRLPLGESISLTIRIYRGEILQLSRARLDEPIERSEGIDGSNTHQFHIEAEKQRSGDTVATKITAFTADEKAQPLQDQRYKNLLKLSHNTGKIEQEKEFPHLLQAASSMRGVEMVSTYCSLIKYLCMQCHFVSQDLKRQLYPHVLNAIRLTKDPELLHLLLGGAIPNGQEMSTVVRLYEGTPESSYYANPTLYFEGLTAAQHEENCKKNPETYAVICNYFAASPQRYSALYCIYLNRFLKSFGVASIQSLDLKAHNVLESVRFDEIQHAEPAPLVSVIMSAYNCEATVDYAAASILRQSHRNVELLICDDSSSDATLAKLLDLAQRDSRVRIFRSKKNQGTYNIRNLLLQRARGEFVTFQDSDDVSLPDRLHRQVTRIAQSDAVAVYGHWIRISEDGTLNFFFDGKLLRFCSVSCMFRRSSIQGAPFRRSHIGADTEFYENLRSRFGSEKLITLSEPLIFGLWSDSSLTKLANMKAEKDGFLSTSRREYSDIAARQRILGMRLISDEKVHGVLKAHDIYRTEAGLDSLEINQ